MKSYADYLKDGNKVNEKYIMPPNAKPPGSERLVVSSDQKPPLDASPKRFTRGRVIVLSGYKGK